MLWRDGGSILLFCIGYALADSTLILPSIIFIFGMLGVFFAAANLKDDMQYHSASLTILGLIFTVMLFSTDNGGWGLLAPLGGLLIFRSAPIQSDYALPISTGVLIAVVGSSHVLAFDGLELNILAWSIVALLVAILWTLQPEQTSDTDDNFRDIDILASTPMRSITASQPSIEMAAIAPFSFDNTSDDRYDEVVQQLETVRTVVNQQVNQTARQIHTVEQLSSALRTSQTQLQSTRRLLQGADATVMEFISNADDGRTSVQTMESQLGQASDTVQSVGESMAQLVADLRRVSEIVTAVSDIATQSNFLALNAQIEAARAGELGRGFTIVAEEVRDLATQSRESTVTMKNILRSIHQTSSQAVRVTEASGSEMAQHTSTIEQLSHYMQRMDDMVSETHRTLVSVISIVDQLETQLAHLNDYGQQLNQHAMQSQASLLMADNLSQSVQAILKNR